MPSTTSEHAHALPAAPIAIVGVSGLFPKAGDIRRYWQNILNRVDAIQEVPAERWREQDFFDDDRLAPDKVYSKWGGFLDPLRFDPVKWKIPPASLESIDPMQLLSLEVADRAFADAGYHDRSFPKERTGVIFACAGMNDIGSDYAFRTMMSHHLPRMTGISAETQKSLVDQTHAMMPEWTEDSFPGILTNVIAGRIANRFDLGGPNYTVDAACAASLAALHAAVAQLRVGSVDMMLVGAADGSNNAFTYMCFAKTHALSPRGRSRPFDDSADGIALGEGIAAILIKRLDDAVRDGDKIYAVIRGIGSSSDGRNRSMTAPHPGGQILALTRAYADAGLSCTSISLVEAHGTGTAVGDGTEITSLNTMYSQECTDLQFAAVGSVKSMIGHTKTCAGLASIVKTALALKHQVLPPTLHVESPNRKVDFKNSAFFVNTESRPWFDELGEHPRRAGVSAFGFGGTNFHVVLEEAPTTEASPLSVDDFTPRAAEILTWLRPTKVEIVSAIRHLREQLAKTTLDDFSALAFSVRHDELPHAGGCRLAIVAADAADFLVKLEKTEHLLSDRDTVSDPTGIYYSGAAPISPSAVAFLFPGQGSQNVNMLRDLVIVNRWSHPLFAGANRSLSEFLPKAITRVIYPPPVFSVEELEIERQALNSTHVAQPALGLVEVFAIELLKRYGVEPAFTAGHSYGEYVALHAAGCLSRDDLLSVSAHRGRISLEAGQAAKPGAMAAVNAGASAIRELITELGLEIELANLNAPEQTIIAGSEEAVDRAVEHFQQRGIRSKRLAVTGAFHTPLMASAAEQLGEILGAVKFHKPQKAVYSNTLAGHYPEKPAEIRKLLQRHLMEPVQFEQQIRQMRLDGADVFIEVGPGRVLTGLVQQIFPQDGPTCLSLDANGRDGVTQFSHVLAQLFTLGLPVDLAPWYAERGLNAVSVTDTLKGVALKSTPKPTDWILTTYKATPVTPLPKRTSGKDGLRAKFGKSSTGQPASAAPSASTTVPQVVERQSVESAAGHSLEPRTASLVPADAGERTKPAIVQTPSSARTLSAGGMPAAPSLPLVSAITASCPVPPTPFSHVRYSATMNTQQPVEQTASLNAASAQVLAQSQALMMQLLDLQKWQQQVALRFIDAHQQLMQHCVSGAPLPLLPQEAMPPLIPEFVPAVAAVPAPAVQAVAVQVAVPPVVRTAGAPAAVRTSVAVNRIAVAPAARAQTSHSPSERHAVVSPGQNGTSHQENGNGTANGHGVAPLAKSAPQAQVAAPDHGPADNGHSLNGNGTVSVPAPAQSSSSGQNAPSVEKFRAALLQAVSDRTGYPIDMLDESLPLEAGLGIDSIKTVEVFSNLKDYHRFFQRDGEDEEEAIKEFMQLKTLGDIISAYELQYQAQMAGQPEGSTLQEVASGNAAVERYTLDAVEAPALNGEKKNSRSKT